MAHLNQYKFCERVSAIHPEFFNSVRVLDVGSMDINGNNRSHFKNCEFIGIDIGEGPNVDIVCSGHLFSVKNNSEKFKTIISTECFEHDIYYRETITNIVKNLLLPGGMFIFSCATTGRQEHGTTRTSPLDSPFTNDYYKNLTEEDIKEFLDLELYFSDYSFSTNDETHDLYFWGIKRREVVDVVMLTNTKDENYFRMTKDAIVSLNKSSSIANFNIILVESNLNSKYSHKYRELGCQVIFNSSRFSFSKNINYGLKHCTSRYICLTNNDVVFHRNWFDNIYLNVDRDSNIGVYSTLDPYLGLNLPQDTSLIEGYKPVGFHSGWCHVIDTQVLEEQKELSEKFDIWFMDDDFCMNLQNQNIKQVLAKESIVYHLGTSSIGLYDNSDHRIEIDRSKFFNKWFNSVRLQSCLFFDDGTELNFESFKSATYKFVISGDVFYETTLNLEPGVNYFISIAPANEIKFEVISESGNIVLVKKLIKYAKI